MTEVTLLGQNVNSYGRDLTRRRPLFAELLRAVGAVEGIRRVRFTSPHPKDLRPETIAAMAETDEVCNHLHLPLQSGSDAVLAAMRRGYTAERYLARLAAARAADSRPGGDHRHHRGLPRGDRGRLRAHAGGGGRGRLRQRLHLHLLAPSGHPGGGHGDRFVPAEVVADRFERLRVVVERSALARHRAPDRTGRGGGGRGALQAGPVGAHRPHRRRTSWSTSTRRRRRPRGPGRLRRRSR